MAEDPNTPPEQSVEAILPYTPDPTSEAMLDRAYWRMDWMLLLFGLALTAVVFVNWGWRPGYSFAFGALLSGWNHRLLKRGVQRFGERASGKGKGGGVVGSFVWRYILLGAAVFVIIKSSAFDTYALLAGLFLPVLVMFGEAAYEAYAALRREV